MSIAALGASAFFVSLHLVQTHLWYDGLAQDVSILSSQGSVIVLLVWALLMENNRRGLFFGKKLPVKQEIMRLARKYHGYFFAWATIHSFWYHPMEPTSGHVSGFFYMFLLLLAGQPVFHTDPHQPLVDLLPGGHGVGPRRPGSRDAGQRDVADVRLWLWRNAGHHADARPGPAALGQWAILSATSPPPGVYGARDLAMIHQITWILIVEYLGVLIMAGYFFCRPVGGGVDQRHLGDDRGVETDAKRIGRHCGLGDSNKEPDRCLRLTIPTLGAVVHASGSSTRQGSGGAWGRRGEGGGAVKEKRGCLQTAVGVGLGLALGALAGILVGALLGVGIATLLGVL